MRGDGDAKGVIVKDKGRPLYYMSKDYLWISFPGQPVPDGKKAKSTKKKK
jgi:hypothetical protein